MLTGASTAAWLSTIVACTKYKGPLAGKNVTRRGPSPPRPDYGRGLVMCQAVCSIEGILSQTWRERAPERAPDEERPLSCHTWQPIAEPNWPKLGGKSAGNPPLPLDLTPRLVWVGC